MKIRHPDDYDLKYGETNYASLKPSAILDEKRNQNSMVSNSSGINGTKVPTVNPISAPTAATIKPPSHQSNQVINPQKAINSSIPTPAITFTQPVMESTNLNDVENILDSLNLSLGRTMTTLSTNMNILLKELRYLISEYRSPFIIFDGI